MGTTQTDMVRGGGGSWRRRRKESDLKVAEIFSYLFIYLSFQNLEKSKTVGRGRDDTSTTAKRKTDLPPAQLVLIRTQSKSAARQPIIGCALLTILRKTE